MLPQTGASAVLPKQSQTFISPNLCGIYLQVEALKCQHHQERQKDHQVAAASLEAAKQAASQQQEYLQSQLKQQMADQEARLKQQHLAAIQALEAKYAADAASWQVCEGETSQQVEALQSQLKAVQATSQQLRDQLGSLTKELEDAIGDAAKTKVRQLDIYSHDMQS